MNSKDDRAYIFLPILLLFILLCLFFILLQTTQKYNAEKLINDYGWQLILIIGITITNGIIVTITINSTLQRSRKKLRLEYHIKDDAPLMTSKGTEAIHIEAKFKSKKKESLSLVTCKIQNSGKTSITPHDFTKDMELHFGDKAEILKVDVLEKKPSGRQIEIMTDDHELFIEPMLLNKKDAVTLAVLLKGVVDKVALKSNVQGTIPEVLER